MSLCIDFTLTRFTARNLLRMVLEASDRLIEQKKRVGKMFVNPVERRSDSRQSYPMP